MRKQGEDFILTEGEFSNLREFIRNTLERAWDRHTDHYLCSDSLEAGMERMDPEMYKIADDMLELLWSE
jgi:hypothetical protein